MAYERAGRLDSTFLYRNNINNEYGEALVLNGRLADAESLFSRMSRVPRLYERSLGLRSLGFLALWRGRLDDAIADFQLATDAVHQQPSALSEGRNRLLLVSLATHPSFEPSILGILAYECFELRRTPDLERVARLAHQRARETNPTDRASVAFVDAMLHIVRHHPDSALAALRNARAFPWPIPPSMVASSVFSIAGQADSARAALQTVLDTKTFGVEGEDDWLRAPLLFGDALLTAGDTAGAERQYQNVLKQWHDAAGENPDLAAAQRRLDALTGKRRG